MFGKDQLLLSKPGEIKTVARSFTDNFRKVSSQIKKPAPVTAKNRQMLQKPALKPELNEAPRQQIKQGDLNEIKLEIKKSSIKLEVVRPYATNFLQKVNRLDEIKDDTEYKTAGKIIYSYSDSKGSWGSLNNKDEKIKVAVRTRKNTDFEEERIDIIKLTNNDIKPSGVYIQVKGWGNLKELSLLNALKNSRARLKQATSEKTGECIIFSYAVSSMSSLKDGGWECKVRVIPGKAD